MRRKICLTILLCFALAKIGFAAGEIEKFRWTSESIQQRLKGRVVDTSGQPISGVTVAAKDGRSLGLTNQEGIFEVVGVNIGDTLSFSYIGYVPNNMLIPKPETLRVVMPTQQGNIDEVVVVGYGTHRRSEMTGSISSVKSSDLEKVAASSFTSAIQGKVPGVTINQTTGAPGGAS